MTLCFSRHQYVEFVFDQSVATWLGLHRRAFEWFGKVPLRLDLTLDLLNDVSIQGGISRHVR